MGRLARLVSTCRVASIPQADIEGVFIAGGSKASSSLAFGSLDTNVDTELSLTTKL